MGIDVRTPRSHGRGPSQLRLGPRWVHAVWLLLGPVCAEAEIDRLDLARESVGHTIVGAAAAPDGGLWLLRRVEHLDERVTVVDLSHTLTKISPALEVEREIALGLGSYVAVAAFGSATLVARGQLSAFAPRSAAPVSQPPAQLLTVSAEPPFESTTLYEWSLTTAAPFSAAPAGESVYLIDYTGTYDSRIGGVPGRLVKVSAQGDVAWRRELGDAPIDVVATEHGALTLGWAPREGAAASSGPARQAVTSFTAEGAIAWRAEIAFENYITEILLAEPNTLVLVARGSAEAVLDLRDRSVAALPPLGGGYPVSALSAHVAHGRLVRIGRAYEQPYLSIHDFAGGSPVRARFQLTSGPRFKNVYGFSSFYGDIRVLPLATERLAVIAEWADALPLAAGADVPEHELHAAVIATDAEARELAAAYGRCVAGDVESRVAAERRLHDEFGVSVSLGSYGLADRRPRNANGCELPSDADYGRFIEELTVELARREAVPWRREHERLGVDVDSFAVAYRLLGYGNRVMIPGRFSIDYNLGTSFGYAAHPDGAAALAAHIVDVVQPFHVEMQRLVEEFSALTMRPLTVTWRSNDEAGDDSALLRIEQAAERILAEVRQMPPEQLEWLRQNRARRLLAYEFDAERFGIAGELEPLADVRKTLLDTAGYPRRRR